MLDKYILRVIFVSLEGHVNKQMTLNKFNIYFEGHVHNDGGHEMAIHVAFLHSQVGN